MASATIKTDYDEVVTVGKDEHGDVEIQIVHGIQSMAATLRPTQAERLANALLLAAGYDEFDLTGHTSLMNELPPDAIRPRLIGEPTDTPATTA